MKSIIILTVLVSLLQCNTNSSVKKEISDKDNYLENTCWAIVGHDENSFSKREPSDFFHIQFKKGGKASLSGMEIKYNIVKDGFTLGYDYYRIIEISEEKIKVAKVGEYNSIDYIKNLYRIDCSLMNDRLKEFTFPDNSIRI